MVAPAQTTNYSSLPSAHLFEELNGIADEPVRPRPKHVVPRLRIDAMGHEIRMILRQPFVLIGGGYGVTVILRIEDHHRNVKTSEHRAGDQRLLAPLKWRKLRRTR